LPDERENINISLPEALMTTTEPFTAFEPEVKLSSTEASSEDQVFSAVQFTTTQAIIASEVFNDDGNSTPTPVASAPVPPIIPDSTTVEPEELGSGSAIEAGSEDGAKEISDEHLETQV
jgi:hypothetical protein